MSSYSLNLQIFCIIFVFFISIFGFYIPIYLAYCKLTSSLPSSSSSSSSFNIFNYFQRILLSESFTQYIYLFLKCCGSGVILGVALVHLLADAVGDLSEYYEYPVGLVLAGIGAIFTLGIDQLAHHVIIQINDKIGNENVVNIVENNNHVVSDNEAQVHPHENDKYIVGKCEHKCDHQHQHSHSHSHNFLSHNDPNSHATIKALIMEGAVAVHSVIIGFGFGVLTKSDSGAIRILTVAFAIHQFFEGISLGTVASESGLSKFSQLKFALTFGLTFPIGAIIGLIIRSYESNTESESAVLTQGFANAIAAGILLHTALSEMIPEDFSHGHAEPHHLNGQTHAHPHNSNEIIQSNGINNIEYNTLKTNNTSPMKNKGSLKLGMYASLSVGFAIMAILAIWA